MIDDPTNNNENESERQKIVDDVFNILYPEGEDPPKVISNVTAELLRGVDSNNIHDKIVQISRKSICGNKKFKNILEIAAVTVANINELIERKEENPLKVSWDEINGVLQISYKLLQIIGELDKDGIGTILPLLFRHLHNNKNNS